MCQWQQVHAEFTAESWHFIAGDWLGAAQTHLTAHRVTGKGTERRELAKPLLSPTFASQKDRLRLRNGLTLP